MSDWPDFVFFAADRFWRCDCWARGNAQLWWDLEGQFYHLHCNEILVLSLTVSNLWYPYGSHLGHLLCHFVIPAHLGSGAVHKELPDWDPVYQPCLFHLHPHVLRPSLWGHRQSVQQHPSHSTERDLRDIARRAISLGRGWRFCVVWSVLVPVLGFPKQHTATGGGLAQNKESLTRFLFLLFILTGLLAFFFFFFLPFYFLSFAFFSPLWSAF